ncbi:MAG: alpha-amylase family glycosyl hydrolase, partial [Litorilituus sp.]|nr:alpha-amylase family glycosyl hydrolase [Litorilituus sp.]
MIKNNEWWRGSVIYQIYPRSFLDSNGDGVGDLKGIINKLNYIASLGVDGIWISPFFTSPMKDFGYDVSNYRDVEPLFGNIEDFKDLITKAHELNLKVLIDQVMNHTSVEHPWFIESRSSKENPKSDWFVWADPKADGSPPNNWLSIFGGSAWKWEARRHQYYLHNFLESQADVNFHNPEVRQQILDETEFWLKLGADGLRLDVVNFYFHDQQLRDNPPLPKDAKRNVNAPSDNPYTYQRHLYDVSQPENIAFLRDIRNLLNKYNATSVGEIGDDHPLKTMTAYTNGNDKLHMAYTFDLLTEKADIPYIKDVVKNLNDNIGDGWPCWALSNHDSVRAVTRWGKGVEPHKI